MTELGQRFVLWNMSAVYSKSVAIRMSEQNILPFILFSLTSLSSFSPSVYPFSTTRRDEIYMLCPLSVLSPFSVSFFLSICNSHMQVLFQNLISYLHRQHFEVS